MLKTKGISTKKTFTTTSGPYTNVTLETPATIPLSDTTKYGKTLVAGDFPTFSFTPESVKYVGRVCVSGLNSSGGNVTINYQMYKNDAAVGVPGNASVATARYYHADCSFYDVSVGDKLEVSVWGSSDTNVTVTNHMTHVAPTRILPTSKNVIDVTETYTMETPSVGTPLKYNSRGYIGLGEYALATDTVNVTSPVRSFLTQSGYNIFRYAKGDYGNSDLGVVNNYASTPYFMVGHIPSTITYREINEGTL